MTIEEQIEKIGIKTLFDDKDQDLLNFLKIEAIKLSKFKVCICDEGNIPGPTYWISQDAISYLKLDKFWSSVLLFSDTDWFCNEFGAYYDAKINKEYNAKGTLKEQGINDKNYINIQFNDEEGDFSNEILDFMFPKNEYAFVSTEYKL